jgi:cobalt-precorrin-7 (C5)-methyltransferase
MEHQLTVVGIGPGHPDYILPAALNEIRLAKILAGSRRALDAFASADQETRIVDGNVQVSGLDCFRDSPQ